MCLQNVMAHIYMVYVHIIHSLSCDFSDSFMLFQRINGVVYISPNANVAHSVQVAFVWKGYGECGASKRNNSTVCVDLLHIKTQDHVSLSAGRVRFLTNFCVQRSFLGGGCSCAKDLVNWMQPRISVTLWILFLCSWSVVTRDLLRNHLCGGRFHYVRAAQVRVCHNISV